MNYKKETIKRALFGIPTGIAIGATFTLIMAIIFRNEPWDAMYVNLNYYIRTYIVSAVIGAVFGGTSIIWDIEKMSLRNQTLLYFILTLTTHLGCALYAQWIPCRWDVILMYGGMYIVIFIIIFIIVYNVQKKKVAEVNEALEE